MFSKIIAVIMSVISVFTTPFSLMADKTELKRDLAKGFYESPYTVRPLEDITVNGVSVSEYSVVTPESKESTLYENAEETLRDELYKASGKKLLSEKGSADKVFVINETLHDTDLFTLKAENGKVYITGNSLSGISRGITAFINEVVLEADKVYNIEDGYEYTKAFTNYVTYEDFGAVGDGKADDFDAIVKAHAYANENGLSVFANETATYYIGGANKTACIMTDTDWSTARFIIDDTAVESIGAWVFNVAPTKSAIKITDKVSPLKIDATDIGTALEEKSLVVLTDSNVKRYIRYGANQNSGSSQTDVILVEKNGSISPDTPLIWDFNTITSATAYPMDTEKLTIRGGFFTTIANAAPSEYTYYARGIVVKRSNTVIDGIYHDIINEGKTGAPYSAFVSLSCCAEVTVKNSTFTGHKKYVTIGSAGTSVSMGTYDIGAATAINAKFINCIQTNDITDGDYWGIAGTNYCKNLVYDGCAFSRFDAHQGVLNATVINSVLGHHGIKLIGSGTALIENTIVLSDSFVDLRSDYGSTWNGEIIIRNCKFYPTGIETHIIKATNPEDHDFGYICYMPENVTIENFHVDDTKATSSFKGISIFANLNTKRTSESAEASAKYPYVVTKNLTISGFTSVTGKEWFLSPNSFMFRNVVVNDLDKKS